MNNQENDLLNSLAQEIGQRIRLAHHIPGRIRLKFDPSLADHPQKESLKHWLPELNSFELVNFNPVAKSALIQYDPKKVPPELVNELFSSPDLSRKKAILNQIKDQVI